MLWSTSQATSETLILILCLENSVFHASLRKHPFKYLSGTIRTPPFKLLQKRNKPETALGLSHNDDVHVL